MKLLTSQKSFLLYILMLSFIFASCNEKQRRFAQGAQMGNNQPRYADFRKFSSLNRHRKETREFAKKQMKAQEKMLKDIMAQKLAAAKQEQKIITGVAIGGAAATATAGIVGAIALGVGNKKAALAAAMAAQTQTDQKMALAQLEANKEIQIAMIEAGLLSPRAPAKKPGLCGDNFDRACELCKNAGNRISCTCASFIGQFDISNVGGTIGNFADTYCDARSDEAETPAVTDDTSRGGAVAEEPPAEEAPDEEPPAALVPAVEPPAVEAPPVEEPAVVEEPTSTVEESSGFYYGECMRDPDSSSCGQVIDDCSSNPTSTGWDCAGMWTDCKGNKYPHKGCSSLIQSFLDKHSRTNSTPFERYGKTYESIGFDEDGDGQKDGGFYIDSKGRLVGSYMYDTNGTNVIYKEFNPIID
ncbi:MAG: hypothetical protein ABIA04_03860 [Pseudomonadota bacterium]